VHVAIARLNPPSPRPVCGTGNLSDEGRIFDIAADHDQLTGLDIRAYLDGQVSQALEALRFVH
jgi:GGDEF domain-containing protein